MGSTISSNGRRSSHRLISSSATTFSPASDRSIGICGRRGNGLGVPFRDAPTVVEPPHYYCKEQQALVVSSAGAGAPLKAHCQRRTVKGALLKAHCTTWPALRACCRQGVSRPIGK